MFKKNKIHALARFLKARENRLGVVVLLLGVFALLFMGAQAYKKFGSEEGQGRESLYTSADVAIEPPDYIQSIEQPKQQFERQPKIDTKDIEGSWDAQAVNGRALLQLKGGRYNFIFLNNDKSANNIYSMGTYEMRNDLVIFKPDRNLTQGKKQFPDYQVLTRSQFPLAVVKKGRQLVMYKPDRSFDVYVPPRHPLLTLMPDEVASFSVLK